jgi:hypothetical protein
LTSAEPGEIAYAEGVLLDWKCGALAEGLACYRNAEFFKAHEHWESVWLKLEGQEKRFLQALIQMTAAFHHMQKGNSGGAAGLLQSALEKLEPCPEHFGGIALASLCAEIREWLRVIECGEPTIPPCFPRICPLDLPPK